MSVDQQVFSRAQSYERRSLEEMLAAIYPAVHRMAHALSGRSDAARETVRFVMSRSLRQLPNWRDPEAAERWFYHHTLLTSRRAAKHPPPPQQDELVTHADNPDPAYVAFIRALRALPMQQREAFILNHGEKLNTRYLGVAMDCSTKAAEQHLQAAEEAVRPLAAGGTAGGMEAMLLQFGRAYARLAPTDELALPLIRGAVRRALWPRRLRRALKWLVILAILAGLAFVWWLYRDQIQPWIETIRPGETSAEAASGPI